MSKNIRASIPETCSREHLFLTSTDRSYTYQDLQCFGDFFIRSLKKYGAISAKRPVGLCAKSSDTLIFIIAACWKLGIPFASFNPDAPAPLLKEQVKAINPSIIISDSAKNNSLSNHKFLTIEQLKCTKAFEPNRSPETGSGIQVTYHHSSKIFGYFFTSGTTDGPKIVPLKRRQMHIAAQASAINIKPTKNECWLLCMPLHHVGGISVILRSLLYGSAIYRMDHFGRTKTAKILSENEKIVTVSLVPTMLGRLLDDPAFTTHASFKAILLGGGPIAPQLLQACINRNIPVVSSYGMTETCAQIAANPFFGDTSTFNLESVGPVFEPNEVEIRNSKNETISAGPSGTIWLKGPQVFDGYFDDSKQHIFDKNDWFNTGDYGQLDGQGNLFVEARRTDLIITGGENVSPIEVESVLKELSFIKDAAVFGVSDPEWGQKVTAAVVLSEGQDQLQQTILNALKGKLEGFKIPKEIFAVQSLPRTQTGKIKRSELGSYF